MPKKRAEPDPDYEDDDCDEEEREGELQNALRSAVGLSRKKRKYEQSGQYTKGKLNRENKRKYCKSKRYVKNFFERELGVFFEDLYDSMEHRNGTELKLLEYYCSRICNVLKEAPYFQRIDAVREVTAQQLSDMDSQALVVTKPSHTSSTSTSTAYNYLPAQLAINGPMDLLWLALTAPVDC